MESNIQPPRWIQSVLSRFADQQTLEEVEGDLLEFYPHWVSELGSFRANCKYFFTVVTLLRPWGRQKMFNTTFFIMIKSYFTMSWRSILKNRVSSVINLSGLTLGLTTSLLVMLVVLREFEYDQQHLKKDSIFLVMKNQRTNAGVSTGKSTAGPMAETLKTDYPQVVHSARVSYFYGTTVVADNKKHNNESGIYADPDLFRMFTLGVVKGDINTAIEKNSVVISESVAKRLFGENDPVGQTIAMGKNSFLVGAVIENIPSTNTLRFGIAIPFSAFEKDNAWLTKWDDNRIQTWIELRSPNDLESFNQSIEPLIKDRTADANETVFAYPLSKLHLYGRFSNGHPSGGLITIVWIVSGFGVFMLLIACINFMNIATAQSTRRAREVGVRKVLGAKRRWIVLQFLNEALVITCMAMIVAVVLSILVIPSFNTMMHASIALEFDKTIVWVLCLSVVLITAILAGSYPALVLSRYSPVRVLKGIIDKPSGLSLRRGLVTFQFFISISTLIGTIILYEQFNYVKNRPIGYEQENLINIPLDSLSSAKFDAVKNEVLKVNGVISTTGTGGNILYSNGSITGLNWPGKKPGDEVAIALADVGYDWCKTMGIEIVAGRDFNIQYKSDEDACLINEAAVEKMNLTNPVGSVIGENTVVGVFKNFVYNNPSGNIEPMAIFLRPNGIHHLYVRVANNNSWAETLGGVERAIKKISPDIAFDPRFTTDEYQSQFEEYSDLGLMVSIFGGITIFISCLGLFGLSGFIAEKRGKEMSIRKVFGADNIRLLMALSTDILKPVVVALLLVIPLSVWLSQMVLEEAVYHVTPTWWMFAKGAVIMMGIAFAVVLYHGLRTATENPSTRLKSE